MVMLLEKDIQTKEVLDWKGIHLLHFMGSSCSQKLRIALGLKGIEWTSHPVNLANNENYTEWFLGINPRGLVPVLVDDGQVIIESNDIFEHLEAKFPEPPLSPANQGKKVHELLEEEDHLHLDLRTLTMRYGFPPGAVKRSPEVLEKYRSFGSGTVNGEKDPHKEVELKFFEDMNKQGITNEQAKAAALRFKKAFDELDERLKATDYLLGDELSIIDIAWYIYAARLVSVSYPLHRLHPAVGEWFDKLHQQPNFNKEVAVPEPLQNMRREMHQQQQLDGTSLETVAGI